MASYLNHIHVLVVDHESECLANTVKLLESCHYRVTVVELASVAIQMLTTGTVKFDIVMANINSPDLYGFKLLQQAVAMDLLIVLMAVDDDRFMATKALEHGAFLYMKKPATMETTRYIWQHVLRENARITKERDTFQTFELRESSHGVEQNPNNVTNMAMVTSKGKQKINICSRNDLMIGNEDHDFANNITSNTKVKRKVCTEWTPELHEKFMNAIEQLGDGMCFPKEITDLMNVPGLTRMQVASHLQKCRNYNWRSPEVRKANHGGTTSTETCGSQCSRTRRFGSMPRLGKAHMIGCEQSEQSHSINTESDEVGSVNMGSGPLVPISSTGGSMHDPCYPDFFDFTDMDNCLVQSLSGMNNANPPAEPYHYRAVNPDQNSMVPGMDTGSQWNSGTDNFGNDGYY